MYHLHEYAGTRDRYRGPGYRGSGQPAGLGFFVLTADGPDGRREQAAFVAWLLSDPGELLTSCAVIECAREKTVEPLLPLEKPYNVLVQQIFLSILFASRQAGA